MSPVAHLVAASLEGVLKQVVPYASLPRQQLLVLGALGAAPEQLRMVGGRLGKPGSALQAAQLVAQLHQHLEALQLLCLHQQRGADISNVHMQQPEMHTQQHQ